MDRDRLLSEQRACMQMLQEGKTISQIVEATGLTRYQVRRRISAAKKRERLDPELLSRLEARGITDLSGLHSGWLLEKDKDGSGQSLYFFLGRDEEKISFADALVDVLSDIPRLTPITQIRNSFLPEEYANWVALADLHVGGDYGNPQLEVDFNNAIDDLVLRMPPSRHAVLIELGDLLEANDHKGVTPTSGNILEVIKDDHLGNTLVAVRLMRRAIYRLLETHETVEVHLIKGNHDTSAYIAVMLALQAHFEMNPRVDVIVKDDEYRVISWGQCAAFPHHGDTLKWSQLKDVFADQFPDEWAAAKAHRIIMTAHFHHDRKADLVGCVAEQYRTLHRPNNWAKSKGLFSRGSLTAMTVHKDRGEEFRTISNIRNNHIGMAP